HAFEVRPVELTGRCTGQLLAGDVVLQAAQGFGRVAVVDAGEAGHDGLALDLARHAARRALGAAGVAWGPGLVVEEGLARDGEGLQLHYTTQARGAGHPSKQNATPLIVHGSSAARATRGGGLRLLRPPGRRQRPS